MDIIKYDSEKQFIDKSVRFILRVINETQGIVRIALSGGSTPRTVYETLSEKEIDFKKVHFYVLDERYVPIDSPHSNTGMIAKTLFAGGLLPESFVYFDTTKDIHACVEDFSTRMPNEDFDLIILGAGPDGHIASLFPYTQHLYSSGNVAHTQTDRFAVRDRVTMTLSPIKGARNILLLLKGANKQGVFEMMEGKDIPDSDFPVKQLKSHPHIVLHYLVK